MLLCIQILLPFSLSKESKHLRMGIAKITFDMEMEEEGEKSEYGK